MGEADTFQWTHVGAFGGGLDYTKNPSALEQDQWAESTGFYATKGFAETAPKLTLLVDMADDLNAGDQIIGIVQEPNSGNALVGVVATGVNPPGRLFRVTRAGVVTEITGAGPGVLIGNQSAVLQAAFINGQLMLNFGFAPSGLAIGVYTTMAIYPGSNPSGTTYDCGSPGTYFHFLCGFAFHGVGAFGHTFWNGTSTNQSASREVTWTPANVETFDVPSIANDADDVILDDLQSGISLLAPVGQSACAIFTRNTISALAPTGGSIPAFTRQLMLQGIGARQVTTFVPTTSFRGHSFWGNSAPGLVYASLQNLHRVGPGGSFEDIGTPIFDAWNLGIEMTPDPASDYHQTFVWDERRGLLLCPEASSEPLRWFTHDPRANVWSSQVQQAPNTGTYVRSAYLWTTDGSGLMHQDLWVASQQELYIEDPDRAPIVAGFVETKDFCFGEPPGFAYIDRIKVDWECLTDRDTDTITILASQRDGMAPGLPGGTALRISPPFVVMGALAGGASELPVRLKTKWLRLRFEQTSGAVRIRGFHIRWQPASDFRTP